MKVYEATENPLLTNDAPSDDEHVQVPATETSLSFLKPVHREAIKRLVEGQSVTDVAKDLGMTRQHISYLKNKDTLFKNELDKAVVNKEQDILKRIQITSYEALDVIRTLMRTGKTDSIKLQAAMTILDRAGYSKLEKRVSVVADAETIIRELHRRKADKAGVAGEVIEVGQDS